MIFSSETEGIIASEGRGEGIACPDDKTGLSRVELRIVAPASLSDGRGHRVTVAVFET